MNYPNSKLCNDCNKYEAKVTYVHGPSGWNHKRCGFCSFVFQFQLYQQRLAESVRIAQVLCTECGEVAGNDQKICSDCCDHSDMEDGHCLICDADRTEELSSLAYDRYKDFIKYGEW